MASANELKYTGAVVNGLMSAAVFNYDISMSSINNGDVKTAKEWLSDSAIGDKLNLASFVNAKSYDAAATVNVTVVTSNLTKALGNAKDNTNPQHRPKKIDTSKSDFILDMEGLLYFMDNFDIPYRNEQINLSAALEQYKSNVKESDDAKKAITDYFLLSEKDPSLFDLKNFIKPEPFNLMRIACMILNVSFINKQELNRRFDSTLRDRLIDSYNKINPKIIENNKLNYDEYCKIKVPTTMLNFYKETDSTVPNSFSIKPRQWCYLYILEHIFRTNRIEQMNELLPKLSTLIIKILNDIFDNDDVIANSHNVFHFSKRWALNKISMMEYLDYDEKETTITKRTSSTATTASTRVIGQSANGFVQSLRKKSVTKDDIKSWNILYSIPDMYITKVCKDINKMAEQILHIEGFPIAIEQITLLLILECTTKHLSNMADKLINECTPEVKKLYNEYTKFIITTTPVATATTTPAATATTAAPETRLIKIYDLIFKYVSSYKEASTISALELQTYIELQKAISKVITTNAKCYMSIFSQAPNCVIDEYKQSCSLITFSKYENALTVNKKYLMNKMQGLLNITETHIFGNNDFNFNTNKEYIDLFKANCLLNNRQFIPNLIEYIGEFCDPCDIIVNFLNTHIAPNIKGINIHITIREFEQTVQVNKSNPSSSSSS